MNLERINEAIELLKQFRKDNHRTVNDFDVWEAFENGSSGIKRIGTAIDELEMAKDFFCTAEAIEKDEL